MHLGVQVEQAGAICGATQQALPHKEQIVVLFAGAGRKKQRRTLPIHARRTADTAVFRHRLAEALRQVGMPTGPVENALQQSAAKPLLASQARVPAARLPQR